MRPTRARALLTLLLVLSLGTALRSQSSTSSVTIRGKPISLHLYGPPTGKSAIVSSGDGGWVHLGPHAAEVLAAHGYFVVGLDSKEYLSAFTSGSKTLRPEDVPGDYRVAAEVASRKGRGKPVLVGVSEGAGLSVLAATDPQTRPFIRGVIALGLPDVNELGWRWSDSIIYITKGVPNEPTFSAAALIERVAPLPMAAIHATGDEFVPVAEIQRIMDRAKDPKKLWIVKASNHRFGGNEAEFDRRLVEAMGWINEYSR